MPEYRVKRWRGFWRVQERKRWLWRFIGPYGIPSWGIWRESSDALWFANLCERCVKRAALPIDGKEG